MDAAKKNEASTARAQELQEKLSAALAVPSPAARCFQPTPTQQQPLPLSLPPNKAITPCPS